MKKYLELKNPSSHTTTWTSSLSQLQESNFQQKQQHKFQYGTNAHLHEIKCSDLNDMVENY